MEKVVTYSLTQAQTSSDQFYKDLSTFTDHILKEAYLSLGPYVNDYCNHIKVSSQETILSKDEYLLELIITGIFWRNYVQKANKTKYLSKVVLNRLYQIRKKSEPLKPAVDSIRGYLAFELLNNHSDSIIENYTLSAYTNLLDWLTSTGEFNEEVIRLSQWIDFYKTKNDEEIEAILRSTISFSNKFNQLGKEWLGKYTNNVLNFLDNSVKNYAHREDFFFTRRRENEYFLNMFGAEIMNRAQQEAFDKTSKKAALLPTCMRTPPKEGCQAKSDGKELVCKQCSIGCNIGKVAKSLEKLNVTPYLIPHSSDFSRFLVKWKDSKETGLIGVACVLNLLTGGYEMKRLDIASQCVFLDYCGCKKHWDNHGFATNLNVSKLKQIVATSTVAELAIH